MIVAGKFFLDMSGRDLNHLPLHTIQNSEAKSLEKIYQKIHIIIIGYLDGSVRLT